MIACYDICIGYIQEESIEKYHSFMLRFLNEGIDSPEKTVDQLIAESI